MTASGRGSALWKFNNSLLQDENFVEELNKYIKEFKTGDTEDGIDKQFKGILTDIQKTVFGKVFFMRSSMPSFSFIGYTLTELFRKSDN